MTEFGLGDWMLGHFRGLIVTIDPQDALNKRIGLFASEQSCLRQSMSL